MKVTATRRWWRGVIRLLLSMICAAHGNLLCKPFILTFRFKWFIYTFFLIYQFCVLVLLNLLLVRIRLTEKVMVKCLSQGHNKALCGLNARLQIEILFQIIIMLRVIFCCLCIFCKQIDYHESKQKLLEGLGYADDSSTKRTMDLPVTFCAWA